MSVAGKRVAIVGAGMGGLVAAAALAQLCTERGVSPLPSIVLLERDESPEAKWTDQLNYSLTIRADGGAVAALARLGMEADARKTHSPSTAFFLADHDGHTCHDLVTIKLSERRGIRARRMDLWKALLKHIPLAVDIHWGAHAVRVHLNNDEEVVHVELMGGQKMVVDLVIVADGVRSTIRESLLPEEKLRHAGAALIAGEYASEELPRVVLHRHGMVHGLGTACWVAHEAENICMWGIGFLTDKPLEHSSRPSDKEALHAQALELAATYPPEIRKMVSQSAVNSLRVVNLYDKMPHRSVAGKVVFIGDANHPVTPFSGNGAGMAIVDGMRLAEALTDFHHSAVASALEAFDTEMIKRSSSVVTWGRRTIAISMTNSPLKRALRNTLFRILHALLHHPLAVTLAMLAVTVLSVLFFLYKM